MKNTRLAVAAFSVLFFAACAEKKPSDPSPISPEPPAFQTGTGNGIVTDSVTNRENLTLKMRFDNAKGSGTFMLNGESFELNRDTTASGIRYSNDTYVFTEWQGEITLTKNGKAIFSHHR